MTFRTQSTFAALAVAVVLITGARCGGPREQPAAEAPPVVARSPERVEFEAIADELLGGMNDILGQGRIGDLRRRLAEGSLALGDRLALQVELTLALLGAGEADEALAVVEGAMGGIDLSAGNRLVADLHRLRALVHLRRAEVENCIRRHKPDCCIFPLRGDGVHRQREPAIRARDDYLRVLEIEPDNLSARWLLNIVYMALGEYPEAVPQAHLIPPEAFASDHDPGRFVDVAAKLGLDHFDLCGGSVVEDLDGDGFLDVLTSTFDPRGSLKYFRSTGDGRFEDRSEPSGLADQLGGLNCLAADYDNDGRRDLLVLRGAWLHDDGRIRNSLLRNEGDGTFRDVTRAAGLAEPARPTQAAVWGDFDGDGDLDLFVGNESRAEWGGSSGDYPSQLFRNEGDGTFTDVAALSGVTNDRYAKGVTAGDYDNDGDLDLYVSNVGRNRLYRNEGRMRFTDVAGRAGVDQPAGRSFASWFFDYDNDGWLDLFVGPYDASTADLAAEALGRISAGGKPKLYRNRRDGSFADVTAEAGLFRSVLPMGANFGDLDNDGYLDIYLGTGEPDYQALMPNLMMRNDGGQRFQDVTEAGGFGHLQKGHGIAFADLDNDGDQDVYHQLGGFYPGDRFHNVLFRNPGHGHAFVFVKLVGTRSNRDGLGARVRIFVRGEEGQRVLHRAVGSVSSFGGSPVRQEIGLGRATAIERVEVDWPAGTRTVLSDVPLNTSIRITEGHDVFERLELTRVPL